MLGGSCLCGGCQGGSLIYPDLKQDSLPLTVLVKINTEGDKLIEFSQKGLDLC